MEVDEIERNIGIQNSTTRLETLLGLTKSLSSPVFWEIFQRWWSVSETTFDYRFVTLSVLIRHQPYDCSLTEENKRLQERLKPEVRIFRGGPRDQVRGLSWTLEETVAVGFAKGHRGIECEDSVVAEALIPSSLIIAVDQSRGESELLVDFRKLADSSITVRSAAVYSQGRAS